MPTFKPIVRYVRTNGTATVFIRVTHERISDWIETNLIANKKDMKGENIVNKVLLAKAYSIIDKYIDRLNQEDIEGWRAKDIVNFLETNNKEISFTDFYQKYIDKMINAGREHPASNYKSAINSLKKFTQKENINFSDITSKLINSWIETDLKDKVRAKSAYPNCISTVFREGLLEYNDYDRGIMRIKHQPFMQVKIPKQNLSEKRAIDKDSLLKLFYADVSDIQKPITTPLTKDVAWLIFCLAGINTADLYYLEKCELKDGVLCYERRKTAERRADNAYMEIRVPDIILPLLEKYKGKNRLFSFSELYANRANFNQYINEGLGELSEIAGTEKVTTYTFRHSWATIAQNNCGASDSEVAFALNHSSEHRITKGYIKSDFTRIDRLNEKVLNYVFSEK